MWPVCPLAIVLLISCTLPWTASQLCDDNPLANNGIKMQVQASTSCLKGRTSDMAEVGTCQDNSAHDIRMPFPFKFMDRSYSGSGSVFVSSNSYVTFGGSSAASSGLGPKSPAFPAVFIGARDNAMRSLFVGPDVLGWRVRFEGWSLPSLVNTHKCSLEFPPTVVWELIFMYNGTLQLCTGFFIDHTTGVSAVSDGVSESFVQKYMLTPSTLYTMSSGLSPCECDDDPRVNLGVKITSQPSQSCMKGRTPDMIDVRSCRRAGSTSVFVPFPFSFLGRTFGGQNDDIFVGDSSFVTFGGTNGHFYSPFEPEFSDLPVLLIGARQNVLKTLSVAPDPLGWRVRYEGWSNHGASLDSFPTLSEAYSCNMPLSLNANITWELLFLFDGTLQLCTGSLMGNLDPVHDSLAIKERICSSKYSATLVFCTNLFPNVSAISAVSDGRSKSYFQKFNLVPSSQYTISTGVRQCPTACDDNPQVNGGVKITNQISSSCLKGQTPEMTVVGHCDTNTALSIRLPFPFHFLGRSYSGGDVFVGDDSIVIFGSPAASSAGFQRPSNSALLVGVPLGTRSNAMRRLSVGPDPLGWRVRFEGWDSLLSLYDTIECNRPANIVWELLFMFNSTMQLCTGPVMNNLDMALNPNAESGVWDGTSLVAKMSLAVSSMYSISTGLPPCSLDISLSSNIASVSGSSLIVRFPVNLRISRYDSVTVVITLQGAGFSCAPNTPISLLISPTSILATGSASISNSASAAPLLTASLRGIAKMSVLAFTIPSVTTPLQPQSSRKSIQFSVFDPNQNIVLTSSSGSLVEIVPNVMEIDSGQPVLQLLNNAIRSSTTVNISIFPKLTSIPASFASSVLVITLAGSGWSLASPAQGQLISPPGGVFASATIASDSFNNHVLRVTWSGAFSISSRSSLQLLVFNVLTVSVPQPAASIIRSAILNSAGAIIASGANGMLDAVVASTMGVGSPSVTVIPPVASTSGVRVEVTLTPQLQYQLTNINLPARIIITLTGSELSCSANTILSFTSPFDAISGALNVQNLVGLSILTIRVTSGTFFSGYPVSFHFGPCSTLTQGQPGTTGVLAAIIDGSERTVAASSTGTLSDMVDDLGQLNLRLTDNSLSLTFTPRLPVPANSFLVISLTGVGLVFDDATMLQYVRPASGAFGIASIFGRPLESLLNISFSTQHSAGITVAFIISPVYGSCFSNISDLKSALLNRGGIVLAATAKSNFSATMADFSLVTVQQLINAAVNGVVIIPDGTFAGKCNCNNRIDENVPNRKADAPVEMKGTAGQSIIDCSGTGLRCLIVQKSTIRVVDIIFKGGSSPVFVSSSAIAAVRAIFDSVNKTLTAQSNVGARAADSSAREVLQKDVHHQLSDFPYRFIAKKHNALMRRLQSDESKSAAKMKPSFVKKNEASITTKPVTKQVIRLIQKYAPSRTTSKLSNKFSGRHLLQSEPKPVLSTFSASVDESGGCILVLAPLHSVFLTGVKLIRCSAIYGGGGFFNVSKFAALKSTAGGNFARQGGGIFVAARNHTELEMCDFSNNTVVASSFSRRPSASSPDPAWAAGAGAWLELLTIMKNCTFERNLALAAKTIAGSGPHALGSALYILQTASGSVLSDLVFVRCVSLCAGPDCYSAGSLFIAFAGTRTSIQGLNFVECQVIAIRSLLVTLVSSAEEASGACITVIDASAGFLNIERLYSSSCIVQSSGAVFGGCMHLSNVSNARISNFSVIGFDHSASFIFSSASTPSSCGRGGVALFSIMTNTIILNFSVKYAQMRCLALMVRSEGALVYASQVMNSSISSMHASNVIYSGQSDLRGGFLFIQQNADVNMTDISIQDSSFGGSRCNGAWMYVISSDTLQRGVFILSGGFVRNVSASGETQSSIVTLLFFLVYSVGSQPLSVVVQDSVFQSVRLNCVGDRCTVYGLIDVVAENRASLFRALNNYSQSLYVSNVSFENVNASCQGERCSVRGACMALSVRDATIINVRVKSASISSYGKGSFAGGSLLLHFHNNPIKSLRISNVTSDDAKVFASGTFSTAIGGVISAIYGNLAIDSVRFLRSNVSCLGQECQSIGGSIAFSSSLPPNNKRENYAFTATITNSEFSHSLVVCSGAACEATGAGIFAGISHRGPFEPTSPGTRIAFAEGAPLNLIVLISNCSIAHNVIRSDSVGATLSGGGVSILLATVNISNSRILQNDIQSTLLCTFAGGAGVYVIGDSARVYLLSVIISLNKAGAKGLGGAIFAATKSSMACKDSTLEFNFAENGGGLFVDSASAALLSSFVYNNSASDKGGGIFCVSSTLLNSSATITLTNVTLLNNFLSSKKPEAVGAAIYVFGDVFLEVRNGTRFFMNGNNQYTTTEAIMSISRQANISNEQIICKSGSVLNIARTEVINQYIVLAQPSVQQQFDSDCNPACLYTPSVTPYNATGGFTASCVPCPRGTYSLTSSSNSSDSVASKEVCRPCPFGAVCNGGSSVDCLKSYWGWKLSERELSPRFVFLQKGYGCEEDCSSISPCSGNRAGTMCGACVANYSLAFFSNRCVPSAQCSSWKWVPLVFICITFQFFFSVFIIQFSSESELLEKQESMQSSSRRALEQVSLFQNLSMAELEKVVSRMELVHFEAQSVVLVQGHATSYMYIIETGLLSVEIHDGNGNDILLHSVAAPDVVGEQSLINHTTCAASVRAMVDSDLWRLDRNCLDDVSEDDRRSFAHAKQAEYRKATVEKEFGRNRDKYNDLWRPLSVLMWFYQLAGIMLSVSSPLDYLDGSAASFSVVSFFVNAKPSYQASSGVSTQTASSLNSSDAGPFHFCVSASMSYSQMYFVNLMYYVSWALLMALLVQKRVWGLVRRMIIRFILGVVWILNVSSGCFKRSTEPGSYGFANELRARLLRRQGFDIDIRGPIVLKWFVTCFSAVATLMMQGTACIRLYGLFDPADELRWIYDGRVACFSDSGELPGLWQVAPVIGVVLALIAPAVLWRMMLGIHKLDERLRTTFQKTLLDAYSGLFFSNARHWMVVMYYERLAMMVVAVYLESAPYFQGYAMLCICSIILTMDCLYRPYKSFSMQVLSGSSAFCILAICGLLLRSQALISAARSPNFAPSNPGIESNILTLELNAVIILLVLFLTTPAFLTIILMPRSQLVLRDAATVLRKSFGGFSKKTSASLRVQGLSKRFKTAVHSGHSRGIEFTHEQQKTTLHVDHNRIDAVSGISFFDASLYSIQSQTSIATNLDRSRLRQLRCDEIAEHADDSLIRPRASPSLIDLGDVRLRGINSSAVDQIHAPIRQEPEESQTLPSDAMFAAVTPKIESSLAANHSWNKTMSPLDPYMVMSDNEFDSAFVPAASSAMFSSRSFVLSSGGSKSRRPLPVSRSRSFSRTKLESGSDVMINTAIEDGHASVNPIVESRASPESDCSSVYDPNPTTLTKLQPQPLVHFSRKSWNMQNGNCASVAIRSLRDVGGATESSTNQKHDSDEASEHMVIDGQPVIPSEQKLQKWTGRLGDRL